MKLFRISMLASCVVVGCMPKTSTDGSSQPQGMAEVTESAFMGHEGGRLVAGPVTVVVPSGALREPTSITANVTGNLPCARRVELSPDGATFASPVELRVQVSKNCMGPGVTPTLAWKQNGAFQALPTHVGTDGTLATPLTHFSPYGVVAYTTRPLDAVGVEVTHNGLDMTLASGSSAHFTGYFTGGSLVLTLQRDQPVADTLVLNGLLATDTWFTRLNGAVLPPQQAPAGVLRLDVPANPVVTVVVQNRHGTKTLNSPADCDPASPTGVPGHMVGDTCVLDQDIQDSVVIETGAVTTMELDCAGHSITPPPAGGSLGLLVEGIVLADTTVRNCVIIGFDNGFVSTAAGVAVINNRIEAPPGPPTSKMPYGLMALNFSQAAQGGIKGNTVNGTFSVGISLNAYQLALAVVDGNHVSGAGTGINIGSTEGAHPDASPIVVTNNVVNSTAVGLDLARSQFRHRVSVTKNTLTAPVALQIEAATAADFADPLAMPQVSHNNLLGSLPVSSVLETSNGPVPAAAEVSYQGEGNFYGHTALPLFVPGTDSNHVSVVDSNPYCARDGWLSSLAPNTCNTPTPNRPVVTFPANASVLTAPVTHVDGTATADVVEVWEGPTKLASAAPNGGTFSIALATPLTGSHSLQVLAVNGVGVASSVSDPANTAFSVLTAPVSVPVIVSPRANERVAVGRPPLQGTGVPASQVVLTIDGTLTVMTMVDQQGNWQAEPASALQAGSHGVTAQTVLYSGVRSALSGVRTFIVNTAGATSSSGNPNRPGSVSAQQVGLDRSVIRTAFGETSTATYAVTYNPLRSRNRGLPFTVVTQRILTTDQRRPRTYVTTSKAIPQSGTPGTPQNTSVNLTFDGRSRTGSIPTATTAFQSTFSVATGYVMFIPRGGAGDCQTINPADPTGAFNGVDFGGLTPQPGSGARTLSFCPTNFTEPGPGGRRLVIPTGQVTTCDSLSLPSKDLGPISRAVPQLKFCCAPGTAAAGVTLVAIEDVGGKFIPYNVTSSMCVASAYQHASPACGAAYPISPNGEACLVESGNDWVHTCTIYGLELVPQGTGNFLASELLTGAIHINVTGPLVGGSTNIAQFTASLPSAPTPRPGVDEDGDGIPDAYDTCPGVVEQLAVASDASRLERDALDSDNDCVGNACDCMPGNVASDVGCPAGSACDQSTHGLCVLPPPRIPTVTPSTRTSLGSSDPLSGSGLETDDAKGATVAVTPDKRMTIFGHDVENCLNSTQILDGGTSEGVWADCPYPHGVQWRTRDGQLGPAWQGLGFKDALSANVDGQTLDYWRLQPYVRTLCGDASTFTSVACRTALETVTEWQATTNDLTAARLYTSGAITPRLPVITTPDGTQTALLVGLRDTVTHPPSSASPPQAPLHSLWYHGVTPMMGNLYLILMHQESGVDGLSMRAVHVQTGLAFADAINEHGDAWISTVGLAHDAKTGSWWVTAACGRASTLCVYHLADDGSLISERRILAAGGAWFDTHPTARAAGGVYVAGMHGGTCASNCPQFPADAETAAWFVDDNSATQVLASSSTPFTVGPVLVEDPGGLMVLDTELIDLVPQPDPNTPTAVTADARVSDQMKTNVRAARIFGGSRGVVRPWLGIQPATTLPSEVYSQPTCTLSHCPVASLRPVVVRADVQGQTALAAFPTGNLQLATLLQPSTRTLMSNLTVGGFPAAVPIPTSTPGSHVFVAKDNASHEYRLTLASTHPVLETVTRTWSSTGNSMQRLVDALGTVPTGFNQCAGSSGSWDQVGGILPTLGQMFTTDVPSESLPSPTTDLLFQLSQYWTTRLTVTPTVTKIQFTPSPLPQFNPASVDTPATDFTIFVSTDTNDPPLPLGFVSLPAPTGVLNGVYPGNDARRRASALNVCEKVSSGKIVCIEIGFFPGSQPVSNCDTWADRISGLFTTLDACRAWYLACTTDACRNLFRICTQTSLSSFVPDELSDLHLSSGDEDQTTTVTLLSATIPPMPVPHVSTGTTRHVTNLLMDRSAQGTMHSTIDLRCFDSPQRVTDFPTPVIPYLSSPGPGKICFKRPGGIGDYFTVSFDVNLSFNVDASSLLALRSGYNPHLRGDGLIAEPLYTKLSNVTNTNVVNVRTNLNPVDNAIVVPIIRPTISTQVSSRAPDLIRGRMKTLFDRAAGLIGDRLSVRLLKATNEYEAAYETVPLRSPGFGKQRLVVHDDVPTPAPPPSTAFIWVESGPGAFLLGTQHLAEDTLLFRDLATPWFQ